VYDAVLGMGVVVTDRGALAASECLVSGSLGIGIQVFDHGILTLERSAVVGTASGSVDMETGSDGPQRFGDGIFTSELSTADLEDCVIAANERTGLYFQESSGEIRDSVVTGNHSYGLAMDGCGDGVLFDDPDNIIQGNGLELPRGRAEEVTDAPGNLPTPPTPDWMGL